ncbi:MAG: hypothetical protein ACXV2C_02010, partial [Candidatus Bathyarchaeia archaeon]
MLKGIQLLTEIPADFPQPLPPTPLPATALSDLPSMLDQLSEPSQKWWEKWLEDLPLPPMIISEGNQSFFFFSESLRN